MSQTIRARHREVFEVKVITKYIIDHSIHGGDVVEYSEEEFFKHYIPITQDDDDDEEVEA